LYVKIVCKKDWFLQALNIRLPKMAGLTIAFLHVIEMLMGAVIQIYTAWQIGETT